jgi:hypothetical protein
LSSVARGPGRTPPPWHLPARPPTPRPSLSSARASAASRSPRFALAGGGGPRQVGPQHLVPRAPRPRRMSRARPRRRPAPRRARLNETPPAHRGIPGRTAATQDPLHIQTTGRPPVRRPARARTEHCGALCAVGAPPLRSLSPPAAAGHAAVFRAGPGGPAAAGHAGPWAVGPAR